MSSALESITCMRRSQALSAGSFVSPLFDNVTTTMLQVQYRMHPTIAEWPSVSFYAGKLTAGVPKELRIPPPGLPWALNVDSDHDSSFPLYDDLSKRSPLLFVKVNACTNCNWNTSIAFQIAMPVGSVLNSCLMHVHRHINLLKQYLVGQFHGIFPGQYHKNGACTNDKSWK